MKKIFKILFLSVFLFVLLDINQISPVYAYDCPFKVTSTDPNLKWVPNEPNTFYYDEKIAQGRIEFTFDTSKIPWNSLTKNWFAAPNNDFSFDFTDTEGINTGKRSRSIKIVQTQDPPNITSISYINFFEPLNLYDKPGGHKVQLIDSHTLQPFCEGTYKIIPILKCDLSVTSIDGKDNIDSFWTAKISNLTIKSKYYGTNNADFARIYFKTPNGDIGQVCSAGDETCNSNYVVPPSDGSTFNVDLGNFHTAGNYSIWAVAEQTFDRQFNYLSTDPIICGPADIQVYNRNEPTSTPTPKPTRPKACYTNDAKLARTEQPPDCSGDYIDCDWCDQVRKIEKRKRPGIDIPNLKPLCDQLDSAYSTACWRCQKNGEIWSAIGCLPTDFSALVNKYVFTTGVGLAGGIAFIYFLYGAFLILTSSGNAEKMEEAKQIITSSLAGLILIIFSVFLLQVIGVQVLKLPGFG